MHGQSTPIMNLQDKKQIHYCILDPPNSLDLLAQQRMPPEAHAPDIAGQAS